MNSDHTYMAQCLALAAKGLGRVQPNPLVGCVIVKNGVVLAEGFHEYFGGAHAEVNALLSAPIETGSDIYINLEPCTHYGKTPPCVDRIIKAKPQRVIIGTNDPNPLVAGKGVATLRRHNITVVEQCLEAEAQFLNRRFFCGYQHHRPYIILKWAESVDGLLGVTGKKVLISGLAAQTQLHQWRSEESAIMIGSETALIDNPSLTVRYVQGKNPVRIVLDRRGRIIPELAQRAISSREAETIIFAPAPTNFSHPTLRFCSQTELSEIFTAIYAHGIDSVLVEGGASLLTSLMHHNLFDEIRIISSKKLRLIQGIAAPPVTGEPDETIDLGEDVLKIFWFKNSTLSNKASN